MMIWLVVPFPLAHFLDRIVTGQIKMERSNRNIALAETRHVGLWSLEVIRRAISHPVVCTPARILPLLESLAITPQSHRNNTNTCAVLLVSARAS